MGKTANKKLTDKQTVFVREYLANGFNATKAALAAGYSKKTAWVIGAENLRKPFIAEVIKAEIDKIITPERIKAELAGIAIDTDVADYETLLQGGKSLTELRAAGIDTRQIKQIKVTRRVIKEDDEFVPYDDVTIQLHDRHSALEKLGKVLAMFTDRVEGEHHMTGFPGLTREEMVIMAEMKGGPKN